MIHFYFSVWHDCLSFLFPHYYHLSTTEEPTTIVRPCHTERHTSCEFFHCILLLIYILYRIYIHIIIVVPGLHEAKCGPNGFYVQLIHKKNINLTLTTFCEKCSFIKKKCNLSLESF